MNWQRSQRDILRSVITLLFVLWSPIVLAEGLEPVEGEACYHYGDSETPTIAGDKAMAMARKNAVENHHVFIDSAATVIDFKLEKDIVQAVSVGTLSQIKVLSRKNEGRDICVAISAMIDPGKTEKLIEQRIENREFTKKAQKPEVSPQSDFPINVWVNKPEGRYLEGEEVIIFVQSDRDGYLKLDYFQADGKVVHLVPNLFSGQKKIQKGVTYTFGGPKSKEKFIIEGPFGDELIKAFVSSEPLEDLFPAQQLIEDGAKHLETIKRGLTRGIKVQGNTSVALVTSPKRR